MANLVYPLYKQQILGAGGINLTSDTIKVALVTAGYTYSAAHQYYSDITPASNVIGTPQQITTPSVTNGVFNGAGVTFSAVSGSQVTQLVLYKDTGTQGTSPLIAKIDTGTGLPVTPNGGNITITWDAGANKIFAL